MSETATAEQPSRQKQRLTLEDIVTNEKPLEADYPSGHKLKAHNGKIPLLFLLLALFATLVATFSYASNAYAVSNLRAEYMEQRSRYESISKQLVKVESDASQLLVTCAVSVDDENLCAVLLEKLEAAEAVDLADPGEIDFYEASAEELHGAIDSLKTINQKAETAYKELAAAIKAVHVESSTKTREDFDRALKDGTQLVEEAERRIEETNGQVRNDGLRIDTSNAVEALRKKIEEARKADDGSLREYTSLTTQLEVLMQKLRDALTKLDTDHQLWAVQQRLNELQAQQVANSNNGNENQDSSNTSNTDVSPPDTGGGDTANNY